VFFNKSFALFCVKKLYILSFYSVYLVGFQVPKIRLYVKTYKQGSRIASVPLRRLKKLAQYKKRRWDFKDGWLILEAF